VILIWIVYLIILFYPCLKGFVFDEDKVSKLMNDMLSAVNYLHQNGVVHRDIKLENFIFADSSHDSRLILIDFGLSKHIDDGEKLNQVVGSCYYTAPEVLNGCYDCKCDVWSIGVICHILLLSKRVFSIVEMLITDDDYYFLMIFLLFL